MVGSEDKKCIKKLRTKGIGLLSTLQMYVDRAPGGFSKKPWKPTSNIRWGSLRTRQRQSEVSSEDCASRCVMRNDLTATWIGEKTRRAVFPDSKGLGTELRVGFPFRTEQKTTLCNRKGLETLQVCFLSSPDEIKRSYRVVFLALAYTYCQFITDKRLPRPRRHA